MTAAGALASSIIVGIISTLFFVLVIWRIDRYEKEPVGLLVAAFLWGAVPAILLSAVAELAFDASLAVLPDESQQLVSASVIAPPIEEIVKAIALWAVYTLARREFDGVLDGIIYGSIIGFGFAMTENVFYFMGAWQNGGFNQWGIVVLSRTLAFGFNHALFTSCTGIGFGLARFQRSKLEGTVVVLLGLGMGIAIHVLHNLFVTVGDFCLLSFAIDWVGLLVLFAVIALAWRKERLILSTQLPEEVAAGLLTAGQLETMVSHRERLKRQWRLLGVSGLAQAAIYRQIVATATELAFKKDQQARMGHERGNDTLIAGLRVKLAQLKARLEESSV